MLFSRVLDKAKQGRESTFVLSLGDSPDKTVEIPLQTAMTPTSTSRRSFLTTLAASAASSLVARDWSGRTPERYPDPDVPTFI